MRLGSRRIALVALICAGIAAAWLADALWQKYDQAREFAALTPTQHYGLAMALRHHPTPSGSNLKEAVRHLEAIPAEGRIRMPSRHLILLKLVLTPRNQEIRSTPVRAPDGQDEHHFPGT